MLIISLLAAAIAANTPTYLRCEFSSGGPELHVTADEPNSTVTVSIPATGYMERLSAAFSPDAIRFRNRIVTWTINRVDLSISRTFDGASSDRSGKCVIEAAPKRAF